MQEDGRPTRRSFISQEQREQVIYDASLGSGKAPPPESPRWVAESVPDEYSLEEPIAYSVIKSLEGIPVEGASVFWMQHEEAAEELADYLNHLEGALREAEERWSHAVEGGAESIRKANERADGFWEERRLMSREITDLKAKLREAEAKAAVTQQQYWCKQCNELCYRVQFKVGVGEMECRSCGSTVSALLQPKAGS